jgi:hypothetical protein
MALPRPSVTRQSTVHLPTTVACVSLPRARSTLRFVAEVIAAIRLTHGSHESSASSERGSVRRCAVHACTARDRRRFFPHAVQSSQHGPADLLAPIRSTTRQLPRCRCPLLLLCPFADGDVGASDAAALDNQKCNEEERIIRRVFLCLLALHSERVRDFARGVGARSYG